MERQIDKQVNRTQEMNAHNGVTGVWQKLMRNKGALGGMIVIGLSLLLSIFGYWLAPDSSPYANRMIVEIGGKSPGYASNFLLVPIKENTGGENWIEKYNLNSAPDRIWVNVDFGVDFKYTASRVLP